MDLFSFSYLFSIWMFVKGIFDFHKSRRTAFELSKDKIDTFSVPWGCKVSALLEVRVIEIFVNVLNITLSSTISMFRRECHVKANVFEAMW